MIKNISYFLLLAVTVLLFISSSPSFVQEDWGSLKDVEKNDVLLNSKVIQPRYTYDCSNHDPASVFYPELI